MLKVDFAFYVLHFCLTATLAILAKADEGSDSDIPVRKCCDVGESYDLKLQKCAKGIYPRAFERLVRQRLVGNNASSAFSVFSKRLLDCHDGDDCFETSEISNAQTHKLLPNGHVLETFLGTAYDLDNYCLEVGVNAIGDGVLIIAFCLPETNVLQKCCPKGEYFDANTFQCVSFAPPFKRLSASSSGYLPQLKKDFSLKYRFDLECSSLFPERFSLRDEAYLDDCGNICLRSPRKCYSRRKFCLDMAFTTQLEPSAYVCNDNVTKTCCQDEFYEENQIECSCGTS